MKEEPGRGHLTQLERPDRARLRLLFAYALGMVPGPCFTQMPFIGLPREVRVKTIAKVTETSGGNATETGVAWHGMAWHGIAMAGAELSRAWIGHALAPLAERILDYLLTRNDGD